MKNKFIALTMSIVIVFSLVGCGATKQSTEEADLSEHSMFIRVENNSLYDVVYCESTKVMYVVSRGGYNQGTFTVLLNADGTPMLYEGGAYYE